MAKINDNKNNIQDKKVEEVVEDNSSTTLSTNDLLDIIASLKKEISDLNDKVASKENSFSYQSNPTEQNTQKLLEFLANKKSDKEVVLIHNRERLGGLSTAIRLTGLSIDFHKLNEQRVLSWQQFEECVSKYRKFFDKEIILLSADDAEIAEKYGVPCQKRGNNRTLTRGDLGRVGDLSIEDLQKYFESLTDEDKKFVCSYWLGKCYEKDPKFYNRYKIEVLNRLSDMGVFDNILTTMNFEGVKK